jgi:putative hydrolases of HD superfamily
MLETFPKRMQQQIQFMLEMDKLKKINRKSPLLDRSRRENSAEHSWHLAMMAMIFGEYAKGDVDINRVIRMLLLHDVVEIDAGDVFLYDKSEDATLKSTREEAAAKRIYDLLPREIGSELRALWEEFEACQTADAKFASAIDRLQPLFHNYFTEGGTWVEFKVTADDALSKIKFMKEGSDEMAMIAKSIIQSAVDKGYLF